MRLTLRVTTRELTWAIVPLVFLAGAAVARAMLAEAPERLTLDLAQPVVVVTAWGAFGARLFTVLALTFAVAAAAVVAGAHLRVAGDAEPPLWPIVACAALALGAGFLWPCLFSSDVYAYAAYGDDVLHGRDPYLRAPAELRDPFIDAARLQWGGTFPACVYGPLFVAVAGGVVRLANDGLAASLAGLRVVASLGFLVAVLLFDRAMRGATRARLRVAAFALNPVALWSAIEGHNDTLVVAAVLAAAVAVRSGRAALAGIAIGLTPLVKAIGAIAGPPAIALIRDPKTRARFVAGLLVGLAGAAALVLPVQAVGLGALAAHGRYSPQFSVQGLVGVAPGLLLAAAIALSAWPALRRGELAGALRLGIALWVAIPNPYPWYALWILPAAAAAPPGPERAAAWLATIFIALRYLPEAFGEMGRVPTALVTAAEFLPLGIALLALRRSPTGAKEATRTR